MTISATEFTGMLKESYTGAVIAEMQPAKARFQSMIKKNTKATGDYYVVPVINANSARRSCTFADAQVNIADNVGYQQFQVPYYQDYAVASWTGKILRQTADNAGAFGSVMKREMDRAIRAAYRSQAIKLFRTGTGSVANIDSTATVASLVLILSNKGDAQQFEVGEVVAAAATDTGALRTGTATITAVDRVAGTITTSGSNWSAQITSLATGDFLFKKGDHSSSGTPQLAIDGWLSYGPASSAALSSSFNNVVRSTDQSRLACLYKDNSPVTEQKPIDEYLVDCVSELLANGSDPDAAFLNPRKYRVLVNRAQTKLVRMEQKKTAVGFGAIELLCDDGSLPVFSDVNTPEPNVLMAQMDTWELVSPGESIGVLEDDDKEVLRIYNSDGYEVRIGGYPGLACHAPGWNLTGTL